MYRVEVIGSVDAIPEVITEPYQDTITKSRDWLAFAEQSGAFDIRPEYYMVYRDGQPVGCLPVIAETRAVGETMESVLWGAGRPTLSWMGCSLFPARMCWSPMGGFSELLLARGAGTEARLILEEALEALEVSAGAEQVKMTAFACQDERQYGWIAALRGHGYVRFPSQPESYIPLQYTSFDEYVAGLSRNARSTVHRDLRRAEEQGIRIVHYRGRGIGHIATQLHSLYSSVRGRYRKPGGLRRRFFERIGACMAGRVRVFAAVKDERLVGFSMVLQAPDEAVGVAIGLDYTLNRAGRLYYNVGYYAPIRSLIEEGCRGIRMGVTAYQAKVRRGARLQRKCFMVKVHGFPPMSTVKEVLLRAHALWLDRKFRRAPWSVLDSYDVSRCSGS